MSARTLFEWRSGRLRGGPRGRPLEELDPADQDLVDDLLQAVGPDLGLTTLRGFLSRPARRPLERHLRRHRLENRRRRWARLHRLRWTRPGRVWAADLAEAPRPIEGGGRWILAVRDLAARRTLAWTALPRGGAPEVAAALERLFDRHGAPLVLKTDNGSCFAAAESAALLAGRGVAHLRSPRAWPRYNGACEAGIGRLRTFTDASASLHGNPDAWSLDDLDAARGRANGLAPRPTGRTRPGAGERAAFQEALEAKLRSLGEVAVRRRARLRRAAIREMLVEGGCLEIRRGWVRARSTGPDRGRTYR